MTPDVDDATLKALQAENFDNLNEVVSSSPFDKHLRFFNFGYRTLDGEESVGPRLGAGFPNKDSAQLLFQLIGDTPIEARDVVEIGCGRGGNLWLVDRMLEPRTVTGVDIAPKSIDFAARGNTSDRARFLVGDAEDVPLPDESADVVLSVETSGTYPQIESFFREVARLLRPGGQFLYTDLMASEFTDPFVDALTALGFQLDHRRDITDNVAASRAARAGRQRLAFGDRPDEDSSTMAEYVGEEGSHLNDVLRDPNHRYVLLRFTRTADRTVPDGPLLSPEIQERVRDAARMAVDVLTIPSASPDS